MIKNDKQYQITKNKVQDFEKTLNTLVLEKKKDSLNQIMVNAVSSQLKSFNSDMLEYEKLRNQKPKILQSPFENFPEALIKIRIVKGYSHNDLAKIVGVKEQQIQRYESTNYESASFERLITIAKSMGVHFEETKIIINQPDLLVEGYDPVFIKEATNKLQSRKSLITV